MKDRYVVIDENERYEFERYWNLPFGYGSVAGPFFEPDQAVKLLNKLVSANPNLENDLIVEKITDDGKEVYFRL